MTYHNILIVKLSAIGDVVHALPVAHALKTCFPDARITWVVEKPAYDLLTHHPDIDEIIVFDKPKFKSVAGFINHAPDFIRELRSRHFDLALDLQGLFKSAAIAFVSGAKRRLVYENAREKSDWFSQQICGPNCHGHVVERYLDVVRSLDCEPKEPVFTFILTPHEQELAVAAAARAGLDMSQRYAILAPGTNWPNKCWPTTHFTVLCDRLFEEGMIPVIVGGTKDHQLYNAIAAGTVVPPVDLIGKTTLKQLIHIIRGARVFVGGDTGPLHLAAAIGTPVVGLYGPTDTSRNGPYGKEHTTLVANRECAGCWQRSCPKGEDCLSVIRVDSVLAAIKTVHQ